MKALLTNSRVNWIYDPHSNQSHHVKPRQTVPKINTNTVPRKNRNTVPKNNNVIQNSQSHARSFLETIPSASSPRRNVPKHSQTMPRSNTQENNKTIQVRNEANNSPQTPKKKRDRRHRRERRAREREKIEMNLLFMMRAGPISAH